MDKVCVTFNYGKCSNRREGDLLEGEEGRAVTVFLFLMKGVLVI